jgi:hypothetical protein
MKMGRSHKAWVDDTGEEGSTHVRKSALLP